MKKYFNWKNIGWFFIIICSAMLINSGLTKVIGTQEMIAGFEFMKLSQYRVYVGIAEILAVVGLVFPKTSAYAAVVITAIMGGAATIHLSLMSGSGVLIPIFVGLLAWTGHCIRKYGN